MWQKAARLPWITGAAVCVTTTDYMNTKEKEDSLMKNQHHFYDVYSAPSCDRNAKGHYVPPVDPLFSKQYMNNRIQERLSSKLLEDKKVIPLYADREMVVKKEELKFLGILLWSVPTEIITLNNSPHAHSTLSGNVTFIAVASNQPEWLFSIEHEISHIERSQISHMVRYYKEQGKKLQLPLLLDISASILKSRLKTLFFGAALFSEMAWKSSEAFHKKNILIFKSL